MIELPSTRVAVVGAIGVFLVYLAALVVHRLVLSPLSGIPGPKLAAVTAWFETYYDVFQGGKFEFEIEKMHRKYGQWSKRYLPMMLAN